MSNNMKLNVGSGVVDLGGSWITVDILPTANIVCDVTKGIPLPSNSVDAIYSEHFLEHFEHDVGQGILTEFYRLLKPNGLVRIAMPSLKYILDKYNEVEWKRQEWLTTPYYFETILSRCQMVNVALRGWGHLYVYDIEEITSDLHNSKFIEIEESSFGVSRYKVFENLETRRDSTLVVEGMK